MHEACRSQSSDEEGLYKISQLLIKAGSDINSKSSDVGEVSAFRVLVLMQCPFLIVKSMLHCFLHLPSFTLLKSKFRPHLYVYDTL